MYQLGIEKKIDLLIDDNKFKEGMYSPGNNLKIYNQGKLITKINIYFLY